MAGQARGGGMSAGGFARPAPAAKPAFVPRPALQTTAAPAGDPNAAYNDSIIRNRELQESYRKQANDRAMAKSQQAEAQRDRDAMLESLRLQREPEAAAPAAPAADPGAAAAPMLPGPPMSAPSPVMDGGAGWQSAMLGQVGPGGLGNSRVPGSPLGTLRAMRANGGLY